MSTTALVPGYGIVEETESGVSLLPGYGVLVQTESGGGGPTYTLAADSGTFTLTGTAAGLKAARKMVAASATFTLTGTAAALNVARKLTAGNGAFTLTGQDVTLTYSPGVTYSMTADSGAFVLTGGAVAFKVARKLTADSATYALTGQDVGLTYTPASSDAAETIGGGGWGLTHSQAQRLLERLKKKDDENSMPTRFSLSSSFSKHCRKQRRHHRKSLRRSSSRTGSDVSLMSACRSARLMPSSGSYASTKRSLTKTTRCYC